MPIFGEYESVGDPLFETSSREKITTVWRVRKAGDPSNSSLVVKHVVPVRASRGRASSQDDLLEADPGIEFLDCLKAIKKLPHKAARSFAPILDFGMADAGVWYATGHCRRGSLKTYINLRGVVDSDALRNIVGSVVAGCLALKKSTGRCHGNIKPANVLLAGETRALRKTPLLLADPMPISAARVSSLGANDQELVKTIFEANDLRSIGELILQLVEGRLVGSGFDYNYPIASSPAWQRLGKDESLWRDWCNRLLDPQLTLEATSLEHLAHEFRPRGSSKAILYLLAVLAVGGLASGIVYYQLAGRFDRHLSAAKKSLETQQLLAARSEVAAALRLRPQDSSALAVNAEVNKLLEDEIKRSIASAGQEIGKGNLSLAEDWLRRANVLTGSPVPESVQLADKIARLRAEAERAKDYDNLITDSRSAKAAGDYEKALDLARKATSIRPQEAEPKTIIFEAEKAIATRKDALEAERKYKDLMTQATAEFTARNYARAGELATQAGDMKYPGDNGQVADLQNKIKEAQSKDAKSQQLKVQQDANYNTAMNKGRDALKFGKYDDAILQFQEALKNHPGDYQASNSMAQASSEKLREQFNGKLDLSLKALTNGQLTDARSYFKQATNLNYLVGGPLAKNLESRIIKAETAQAEALQLKKDQDKNYNLAMKKGGDALDKKNFDEAISQFQVALNNRLGDLEATRNLETATKAKALQDLGKKFQEKIDGAMTALERQDYPLANQMAQAADALKYPGGSEQVKLLQGEIKKAMNLATYKNALIAATNSFKNKDFTGASSKLSETKNLGVDTKQADAYLKDFVQPQLNFIAYMGDAKNKSASDLDGALAAVENALMINRNDPAALALQNELLTKKKVVQIREGLDNRLRDLVEIYGLKDKDVKKAAPTLTIVLRSGKDRAKRDDNEMDTKARNGELKQEIQALEADYKQAGIDVSGDRKTLMDLLVGKIPDFLKG